MDPFSITALSNLLQEASGDKDSDSEDDDYKPNPYRSLGPGDVGPKKQPDANIKVPETTESRDVLNDDENPEEPEDDEEEYDPRPQPEYDISYQQALAAEDMFLGMGNKTPATSSCENMVIKIKLPETKLPEVELDCKDKFVDCRTPKYKLGLHLPHRVDGRNGKATWDGNTFTLTITARMIRDFDFANF